MKTKDFYYSYLYGKNLSALGTASPSSVTEEGVRLRIIDAYSACKNTFFCN